MNGEGPTTPEGAACGVLHCPCGDSGGGKAVCKELHHRVDSFGVTYEVWNTPSIRKAISSTNFSLSKPVVQVHALLRWLDCPWPQPWLRVRHGAAAGFIPGCPSHSCQLLLQEKGTGQAWHTPVVTTALVLEVVSCKGLTCHFKEEDGLNNFCLVL